MNAHWGIAGLVGLVVACAARDADRRVSSDRYCGTGKVENFMAARAQQCWYTAPAGRWRIVNHDFHYDVLVMDTQASSVAVAGEIVRRLTEVHGERFQEMLVYVAEESAAGPERGGEAGPERSQGAGPERSRGVPVRRVRWTRNAPPEFLDFTR